MRPTGTTVQRRGRPVPTARLACGRQRAGEWPGGDGSPGIPPEAHSATSRPAHTQLLCEGAALPPTPALILIAVLVGRRAFQSDATAPRDLGAPIPLPGLLLTVPLQVQMHKTLTAKSGDVSGVPGAGVEERPASGGRRPGSRSAPLATEPPAPDVSAAEVGRGRFQKPSNGTHLWLSLLSAPPCAHDSWLSAWVSDLVPR